MLLNLTSVQNETNNSISDAGDDRPLNWTLLFLVPIICVVAAGNVLVILAVCMDRKLRSATNYFLTSLAVADLLVALTVMPPSVAMIVNNYQWPLSDEMCGLWVMLDVFFSTSSIMHLCMISLDRYHALSRPFGHGQRSKRSGSSTFNGIRFGLDKSTNFNRRVASRIFVVWAIALGIAMPLPILGRQNRTNVMIGNMCAINMPEFATFGSLIAFFLPLIIMFIMYTLTIRFLRKQAHMVSQMMEPGNRNSSSAYRSGKRKLKPIHSPSDTTVSTNLDSPTQRPSHPDANNRHKSTSTTADDDASVSDSLRSVLITRRSSSGRSRISECGKERCACAERKEMRYNWAPTRPLAKALQQVHVLAGFGGIAINRSNNETSEFYLIKKRCDCEGSQTSSNSNEENRKKSHFFQRKLPSYRRRISSSFKNRAMASINNEQRASKILGLIFVLFCLSWCPFFITNVVSRFCTNCNEELMGECMNWFVWVGYVSSGVNPCVYTLFSRRFRQTFAKLVQGKCSTINKRNSRRSHSSHRDNFSNVSFRTTADSVRKTSKQLSTRSFDPALTPSMRSTVAGVEKDFVRHDQLHYETTPAVVRSNRIRQNVLYQKQKLIQEPTTTTKLWRSTWHASTMACTTTSQNIVASDSKDEMTSRQNTNYFRRHYSADDVDDKEKLKNANFQTEEKQTV